MTWSIEFSLSNLATIQTYKSVTTSNLQNHFVLEIELPLQTESTLRRQHRQRFFLLLIDHVQRASGSLEADVVDVEHPHAQRDLGANRIQLRVECFLSDIQVGDANWCDACLAPDEEGEVRLHGKNLDGAEK